MAQRAELVQSAPAEQGDHVVSLQRPGQVEVFGVVRCDKAGRRLVAVATTAEEAQAKAQPVADRAAPVERVSPWRAQTGASGQSAEAQKRAAEQTMQSELAEYRREVARVTGQAAKLV